jgi:cobalt-precorrin 5A hydrolase / precorrin-3B C17-methyltransferase
MRSKTNITDSSCLWIGIGCRRETSSDLIELAITQTLAKANLSQEAIAGIATIDLKRDHRGILEYCQQYNLPIKFFSAQELQSVPVSQLSAVVREKVNTPSVAEASALLASQQGKLLVTKQVIKLEQQLGAVTIAIAV